MKEITPLTSSDCFTLFSRTKTEFDFPLHYHEELELNFIENASGAMRVIGDHISEIDNLELVLVGSNLPHVWQTHKCKSKQISEITIQFHKDLFDEKLLHRNQLSFIRSMLEKSSRGILFSRQTIKHIAPRLINLQQKHGFDSVLELLSILHELSISSNKHTLSASTFNNTKLSHNSRRIEKAFQYMNQNFDFISFPDELTTGSSIMPHKKNPDVFELIRARCNRIQSIPNELSLLMNNLPSGYHRDMQLTKEILFPAIEDLKNCISMTVLMLSHIRVRKGILQDEKYKYLFSVEAVNELANQGIPFRNAYQMVGNQINKGEFSFDQSKPLKHTHEGSLGNLNLAEINSEMENVLKKF